MFGRHRHGCNEQRHARSGGFGFGRHFGAGHHPGHQGRHGRMRGGRFFDRGDLRYVLLHLISEKPRHGYELITAIEEKFGGMYSPSPGVIYPTLTLLEELGYVRSETASGTKRLYTITDEGRAFLLANQPLVDSILARMAELAQTYGGGPAPEIVRAMQNLKLALNIRLGRGPLTPEQVRAITTALDRVVGEIEGS
jgi:DNA-binding PadR family transcriptional regulator